MKSRSDQSESEFLRLEAEKAKLAISESLKKARAALGNSVDPRVPLRKHPLIGIGTAAVAGFVATVLMVPSKEERELRHLERLRRAMHPEPPKAAPTDAKSDGNGSHAESPAAEKKPIWMTVLKEVIAFAKPILLAQITTQLKREAVSRPPNDPSEVAEGPDKSN
jgi:hypothetical protein